MHKYLILGTLCWGVSLGCLGDISQRDTSSSSGAPGTPTNPVSPGTPVSGPPSPDTGITRLTRTEYKNSLRDLLGDTSQTANTLDPDQTYVRGIFDNNAEVLSGSVPSVDKYDIVASQVVETAFRANSASRAKLVKCNLAANDMSCARTTVAAFARRAWRRPVANDEVDNLMTAALSTQADGMEEVVKLAFRMMLVSPNFLYRVELDPPGAKGLHAITPHQLASRLSFFVWSSTPDDELLDRADDSTLAKPDVFTEQLGRLMADKRSDALIDNFAAQWLNTRLVADASPDKMAFPTWDDALRTAIASESQLFFREFLRGDHNVVDMLDTDFTFANDRLAKHYGLPTVAGAALKQVSAGDATRRFGILSQASVLTVTSNADRTVPSKRGKWILIRLLCSPPGNPPAMVPPLPADPKTVGLPANATIRQRMEVHATKPACAACHGSVDPMGFALEHYNGIGAWRDKYPNNTIDATGKLEGKDFDGAQELSKLLRDDPRFGQCFTQNMFEYALGRAPTAEGDTASIKGLSTAFVQKGGRIPEIIGLVAASNAFQMRGGQP